MKVKLVQNTDSKTKMSERLPISGHKKKCIVYANCQCYLVTSHLNLSNEFMQEYSVEKPFLNFEAIKNKTGIPSEIIEKTKLFLYQPIGSKYGEQSTAYILKKLPSDCTCISFPYVYFDGYWPQDTENPMNKPSKEYPFGKFPYGDSNIITRLKEGASKKQIIREIQEIDFYGQDIVLEKVEKTLEELKKREALTDTKVSHLIKTNYSQYQLFHSCRHPANLIGLSIANQILERLDMDPIKKPCNTEILSRYQVPIYPSVIKTLDLEFVDYNSKYTLYFSDKKLTFNEYIEEYLKQYQ